MRDIIRLVVVLTLICVAAAISLAKVYDYTKEPIAQQRRLAKLKAIEAVLPEHDNQPDQDTQEFDVGGDRTRIVYLGLAGGKVIGLAFEIKSLEGYGGEIVAMLGIDPNGAISGVEIVKLAETPGLGAKIANPDFRSQFLGKSLRNTRFMLKKDGGDIDQVTGATISPRAIVNALKEGLEFFDAHRSEIFEKGSDKGTQEKDTTRG